MHIDRNPPPPGVFAAAFAAAALLTIASSGCSSAPPGSDGDDTPPVDAGPDGGTDVTPDGGIVPCGNGDVPFTLGVSTLAGSSVACNADGPRAVAGFSDPVNVAYHDGTLYVADFDNGRLRAIDIFTRTTSTIIAAPDFKRPFGLAFAADGTFYVSTDNDQAGAHSPTSGTIWKIDLGARTAVVVANAIGRPRGIVALPDGRIAATDYLHHVVEIVDPANGSVTVIAGALDTPGSADGAGAAARFSAPYGIGMGSDGKLVVADYDNSLLRQVALDGTTTTLTVATGQLDHPQAITIASDGAVYVTDTGNYRVRKISGSLVTTVAGDGQLGYLDADDPLAARFYGLEGLSLTPDGTMLYVADGNRGENLPYDRIRQIKLD